MSKKLYLGIAAGILAGIAIPVLIKLSREDESLSGEELSDYNSLLDKANYQLAQARNRVDTMMEVAARKSESVLKEASGILALAKEKTATIHYELPDSAKNEIEKIKEEIDDLIKGFRKSLELK